MTFAAIGGLMLMIVLMFYIKMINKRLSSRQHKSQTQHLIEKAEIFESIAKDKDALKVIEDGLKDYPNSAQLKNKQKALLDKLSGG